MDYTPESLYEAANNAPNYQEATAKINRIIRRIVGTFDNKPECLKYCAVLIELINSHIKTDYKLNEKKAIVDKNNQNEINIDEAFTIETIFGIAWNVMQPANSGKKEDVRKSAAWLILVLSSLVKTKVPNAIENSLSFFCHMFLPSTLTTTTGSTLSPIAQLCVRTSSLVKKYSIRKLSCNHLEGSKVIPNQFVPFLAFCARSANMSNTVIMIAREIFRIDPKIVKDVSTDLNQTFAIVSRKVFNIENTTEKENDNKIRENDLNIVSYLNANYLDFIERAFCLPGTLITKQPFFSPLFLKEDIESVFKEIPLSKDKLNLHNDFLASLLRTTYTVARSHKLLPYQPMFDTTKLNELHKKQKEREAYIKNAKKQGKTDFDNDFNLIAFEDDEQEKSEKSNKNEEDDYIPYETHHVWLTTLYLLVVYNLTALGKENFQLIEYFAEIISIMIGVKSFDIIKKPTEGVLSAISALRSFISIKEHEDPYSLDNAVRKSISLPGQMANIKEDDIENVVKDVSQKIIIKIISKMNIMSTVIMKSLYILKTKVKEVCNYNELSRRILNESELLADDLISYSLTHSGLCENIMISIIEENENFSIETCGNSFFSILIKSINYKNIDSKSLHKITMFFNNNLKTKLDSCLLSYNIYNILESREAVSNYITFIKQYLNTTGYIEPLTINQIENIPGGISNVLSGYCTLINYCLVYPSQSRMANVKRITKYNSDVNELEKMIAMFRKELCVRVLGLTVVFSNAVKFTDATKEKDNENENFKAEDITETWNQTIGKFIVNKSEESLNLIKKEICRNEALIQRYEILLEELKNIYNPNGVFITNIANITDSINILIKKLNDIEKKEKKDEEDIENINDLQEEYDILVILRSEIYAITLLSVALYIASINDDYMLTLQRPFKNIYDKVEDRIVRMLVKVSDINIGIENQSEKEFNEKIDFNEETEILHKQIILFTRNLLESNSIYVRSVICETYKFLIPVFTQADFIEIIKSLNYVAELTGANEEVTNEEGNLNENEKEEDFEEDEEIEEVDEELGEEIDDDNKTDELDIKNNNIGKENEEEKEQKNSEKTDEEASEEQKPNIMSEEEAKALDTMIASQLKITNRTKNITRITIMKTVKFLDIIKIAFISMPENPINWNILEALFNIIANPTGVNEIIKKNGKKTKQGGINLIGNANEAISSLIKKISSLISFYIEHYNPKTYITASDMFDDGECIMEDAINQWIESVMIKSDFSGKAASNLLVFTLKLLSSLPPDDENYRKAQEVIKKIIDKIVNAYARVNSHDIIINNTSMMKFLTCISKCTSVYSATIEKILEAFNLKECRVPATYIQMEIFSLLSGLKDLTPEVQSQIIATSAYIMEKNVQHALQAKPETFTKTYNQRIKNIILRIRKIFISIKGTKEDINKAILRLQGLETQINGLSKQNERVAHVIITTFNDCLKALNMMNGGLTKKKCPLKTKN